MKIAQDVLIYFCKGPDMGGSTQWGTRRKRPVLQIVDMHDHGLHIYVQVSFHVILFLRTKAIFCLFLLSRYTALAAPFIEVLRGIVTQFQTFIKRPAMQLVIKLEGA